MVRAWAWSRVVSTRPTRRWPARNSADEMRAPVRPPHVRVRWFDHLLTLPLRGAEGALDFVVVVTPNPLHYDVSRTFLEARSRGLHHSLLLKLRGTQVLSSSSSTRLAFRSSPTSRSLRALPMRPSCWPWSSGPACPSASPTTTRATPWHVDYVDCQVYHASSSRRNNHRDLLRSRRLESWSRRASWATCARWW